MKMRSRSPFSSPGGGEASGGWVGYTELCGGCCTEVHGGFFRLAGPAGGLRLIPFTWVGLLGMVNPLRDSDPANPKGVEYE
jgi:hypothetical protein